MCGGVHYGEVAGLVSVERWSCREVLNLCNDLVHVFAGKSPINAIFRPLRRNGLHRRSMSEKDLPKLSNTIWYA